MSIGIDLDQRRQALKDEYQAALRFQMQWLAPHFPSAGEIELAGIAASELQNEDTDKSLRLMKKRELLQELAYDFKEIYIDGQSQIGWKGRDSYIPKNDGTQLYLTQSGQLVEEFPEGQENKHIRSGLHYRIISTFSDELLSNDVAYQFLVENIGTLKKMVFRWDKARKLVR